MNRSRRAPIAGAAFVLTALLAACGSTVSGSKPTTTVKPEVTTTVADTTTTTTEATTTTTASKFPTYAAYVAALPPGTERCNTKGTVTGGDGQFGIGGPDSTIAMIDGVMTIFCPGAKLTAGDPLKVQNQFGEPIPKGAPFSVAVDGSLVQLSSF